MRTLVEICLAILALGYYFNAMAWKSLYEESVYGAPGPVAKPIKVSESAHAHRYGLIKVMETGDVVLVVDDAPAAHFAKVCRPEMKV